MIAKYTFILIISKNIRNSRVIVEYCKNPTIFCKKVKKDNINRVLGVRWSFDSI